jgi:flagellar biosynthesis GTPase FlhF
VSFHIDQVHSLRVEESPFDNLILPGDVKNTIQSIIWSHKQPGDKVKAWSADFIQEKGEGQIFLLHGTPGVGKTCTAGMCFAAFAITYHPTAPLLNW